jgi:hypothetical protein
LSALASTAPFAGGEDEATTAALPQRLLNIVLFVTVLFSAIAFIEPSPHDALMGVLLVACIAARVRFDRKLIPLLLLLSAWLIGGLLSLIQVGDLARPIQYIGTSVYLALAALIFACLFCDGNMVRLLILRRAYVIAALIATTAGFVGFFHLLPHSDIFLFNERVSGTFKDPNVYGPFLIFPLLLLMNELITQRVRLSTLAIALFLLGGLLLSFSRGAWVHFVVSAVVAVVLLVITAPDQRVRGRILVFTLAAALAVVALIIALTSISSVHDLLMERAKAIQPYDVGPGGRFWEQRIALSQILLHPNGLGPYEFDRIFGMQQHNVYMQAFLVYGWLGGMTYLTLVVATLMIGARTVVIPSAWQPYLIAAYAFFVGEAGEGVIIDSDHWRHFFLALGMVWGLAAASMDLKHSRAASARASLAAAYGGG